MPRLKPEDIIEKVDGHYEATHTLRARMDADHQLYKLDPYDAGDGYKSYTSNEPQTYADKVIAWMTAADLVIRIPPSGNPRNTREINNDKERFIIGALRSANERLSTRLVPPIKNQLAWYIAIRGWYAGRAILTKDGEDKTCIDVTPWDPMHTYWGVGPDGLAWACYRVKKTKEEIEAQYGVRLGESQPDTDGINVYDYYDKEYNTVVVPGRFIKKRTPHGSDGHVPVFLGPVGSTPLIQSMEWSSIDDTLEDYGESVFKATRNIYENHNFMMSVMLELTARSRKQGLKVHSRDGTKTLDEDPYKEGTEISLGQGEEIQPLGLLEMAQESGAFMGLVAGEMQRGSIPHTVYGELPFQLSGFAINTLRQGVESVLVPRIQAMERAYVQISNLLCDQYQTGAFKAVELSGQDNNRMYFSEEITPAKIRNGGDPEIKIVTQLPSDDMSRYGMAQIAPARPVDTRQYPRYPRRRPGRGRRQGTNSRTHPARSRDMVPVPGRHETGQGRPCTDVLRRTGNNAICQSATIIRYSAKWWAGCSTRTSLPGTRRSTSRATRPTTHAAARGRSPSNGRGPAARAYPAGRTRRPARTAQAGSAVGRGTPPKNRARRPERIKRSGNYLRRTRSPQRL